MTDLFSDALSDPSQSFTSDSDAAQRIAATQRMFQRLGILKAQPTGTVSPAVASPTDPLGNYKLSPGLPPAFGGQMRQVNRSRFSPPPRMPELDLQQASSSLPPPEDLGKISPPKPQGRGDIDEILKRVGSVMDSFGSLPYDTEPRPTISGLAGKYRTPKISPMTGPDTGDVDPNAYASGAPKGYFEGLQRRESSNNPNAINSITGAAGLYQIQPRTWRGIMREAPHLGLTSEGILDKSQQNIAVHYYTDKSLAMLRPYLGREPTKGELYALHFFGHAGGMNLMDNLEKPLPKSVGLDAIEANPWIAKYRSGHALLSELERMMARNE